MAKSETRLRCWRGLLWGGWICLLAVVFSAAEGYRAGGFPGSGRVVAVLDGDTVVLDSGEKVRYLGIDAPEVAHEQEPGGCYGEQAKRANSKWVLHKWVTLAYERPARDRYGRLLAYVFLGDGRCVNGMMLKTGQAYLYRMAQPFGRWQHFLHLQRQAIEAQAGLWGYCKVKQALYYVGNRHSFVVHRPGCPFGKSISSGHRVMFGTRWAAFRAGYRPCRRCTP